MAHVIYEETILEQNKNSVTSNPNVYTPYVGQVLNTISIPNSETIRALVDAFNDDTTEIDFENF